MNQLVETVRSSVQTWECDQMGHMNVQFYVAREQEGIASLASALGLRPRSREEDRANLQPLEQHIRFHRELRPGAPYVMQGGVIEAHREGLVLFQEMKHTMTGATAATFVTSAQWSDLEFRTGLQLPSIAIERASALTLPLPAHAGPRGLVMDPPRPAPTLEEAQTLGLLTTLRGQVTEELCDSHGFMKTQNYMGRLSDSIPNLLAQTTGRSRDAGNAGGAALEYRFVYHKPARAGDLLVVRSGMKSVGTKTYVWCHWMFDAETGECFATAEAVAVSLDLVERKAMEIPPHMRAVFESLVIPGLSL
jgi:acyl-CoA thioester hydrolase